jgi:hypothetical protein
MSVIVRAGTAVIGGSIVTLAGDTAVAISAPDPTYPRFDLITLKGNGTIGYYTGIPDAPVAIDLTRPETYVKPKPPPTPAGEVALAEVFVPAGATAIDKIIDRRIVTASMATQQITLAPLTSDPALVAGRLWYRADLQRIRYSPDGSTIIQLDPPASPADIWTYSDRTLTQTKFPFWSAIITQQSQGRLLAGTGGTYITIQPPPNEVWFVFIDFSIDTSSSGTYIAYNDYDGATLRIHTWMKTGGSYGNYLPQLSVTKILTNSLYARLDFYPTSSTYLEYGYSGFKLSQPLWTPKRLNDTDPKPWKRATTLPLPDPIKPLDKYKAEILGLDPTKPEEYALGIILEEDTPLAIDPATNFPVERLTAVVKADVLADLIAKFKAGKADPATTGYLKYLRRWKAEGIDFGIPGI